jgi:large subunit ribosomal protein L11
LQFYHKIFILLKIHEFPLQSDRSYIMEIFKPPVSHLLKHAAGIKRCSMEAGHKIAGVISLKHVYEIAKFKSEEINCAHMSMKRLCISVINTANQNGIKIVKDDIDTVELSEFLEKRALINEEEIKIIAEKKAAKLMRAANVAAAAAAAAATDKDKKK